MADLLVDTDVLIDHLRLGRRFASESDALSYSTVTRAELFAGRNTDEDTVRLLLAPLRELAVDREVAELAGRVRREGSVQLPDALIAATALVHGLVLMTRDRRDFEAVAGLELSSPS